MLLKSSWDWSLNLNVLASMSPRKRCRPRRLSAFRPTDAMPMVSETAVGWRNTLLSRSTPAAARIWNTSAGVLGASLTGGMPGMPMEVLGMFQLPGKPALLGVLGVLGVVGVAAVLGVLGVWACAKAGAISTAAIESNGLMGSFFKAVSSRFLRLPCAGACAQGPGEQRGLGWMLAHRVHLQQWLDRTIVQSISGEIGRAHV